MTAFPHSRGATRRIFAALMFALLATFWTSTGSAQEISRYVTWNCVGTSCAWGPSATGAAAVWPAALSPVANRVDYVATQPVYLPASEANGTTISVASTNSFVVVLAGPPDGLHTALAWLGAGESYDVSGLAAGDVLSVQSPSSFTYTHTVTTGATGPPPLPAGAIVSLPVDFVCDYAGCTEADIPGDVIEWPTWSAHTSNGRSGANARRVFDLGGNPIHPYMGPWAQGCAVTAEIGPVVVTEWEHGSDVWRQTTLAAGESHTIALVGTEDSAMIAGDGPGEIAVTLSGCVPEALTAGPGPDPGLSSMGYAGTSQFATWNCTGTFCPWGDTTGNDALVWPADLLPVTNRYGYTTNGGVYVPAENVDGMTIEVSLGVANAYKGLPDGSHTFVASITPSSPWVVSGLAPGEVLSLQSSLTFTYALTPAAGPGPNPDPPIPGDGNSAVVEWVCTGANCPWGDGVANDALVWPSELNATSDRFGYTTTSPIYLPAAEANGTIVTVDTGGSVVVVAGDPQGTHLVLAYLSAGESYAVFGLGANEVLSVQSDTPFTYTIGVPAPPPPPDPVPAGAVASIDTYWWCNTPGCTGGPWTGGVIDWPEWAAYSTNNRSTEYSSRTTYDGNGNLLHPYMGPWADGCQVTAATGLVLIIEWERGQDIWRETYLSPGETHTISLQGAENGAMIETTDGGGPFSVFLQNCEPQPLPPQ